MGGISKTHKPNSKSIAADINAVVDSLPDNLKSEFNVDVNYDHSRQTTFNSEDVITVGDIEYIKLHGGKTSRRSILPTSFLNSKDKLEIFSLSYLYSKGYRITHTKEASQLLSDVVSSGVCDSILDLRDKLISVLEGV